MTVTLTPTAIILARTEADGGASLFRVPLPTGASAQQTTWQLLWALTPQGVAYAQAHTLDQLAADCDGLHMPDAREAAATLKAL